MIGLAPDASYFACIGRASRAPLRHTGGSSAAATRRSSASKNIVGAAGRAGIHRLDRDPAAPCSAARSAAATGAMRAAEPEQQEFDPAMLDDRGQALGRHRRRCPMPTVRSANTRTGPR